MPSGVHAKLCGQRNPAMKIRLWLANNTTALLVVIVDGSG